MGILSEQIDAPQLGRLIKMYTYTRGTGACIKNQEVRILKKRYQSVPTVCDLMDVNMLLYPRTIGDAIKFVFEEMFVTDVLPKQIIPILHHYGIMADAVNMVIQRERSTNMILEVQFRLYVKKSGRERYVRFGHISLVMNNKSNHHATEVQKYWEMIIKAWKESEPMRLTSIFRNKKSIRTLMESKNPFISKYESYVSA